MTRYDFSKTQTDELLRKWRWHDQDRGCMTFEDECRRMHIMDTIGEELQRRNVPLPV